MMPERKMKLIEKLTGVYSSKRSYYAELKEKMAEITRRNTQLEILNDLVRQLSVSIPTDHFNDLLERISVRINRILPLDRIWLFRPAGERLKIVFHHPGEAEVLPVKLNSQKEEFLWRILREKKQLIYQSDSEKSGWLKEWGINTAVVSPLAAGDKVFGLLVIANVTAGRYDEADLNFIQQLANQLAIYFQEKELFSEINRAKTGWEATFRAVGDLVIVVDQDMLIKRVNQAAIDFCHLPEEKIIGQKYCDIFGELAGPCESCAVGEVLRTGEVYTEQRNLENGRVMELYSYPAFHQDKELGVVIYAKDITERMKMQAQLLQNARLAALGEMSAGVAHELNTPLAVILGDAQLLERRLPPNDPGRKLLTDIVSSGMRCKQIVRGLLTFSRQEQYVFEPLSVEEVVKEALELVAYQIETDNIKIELHLADGLPEIEGNKQQLEQVIVNLLLNAKQAFKDQPGERVIGIETAFLPAEKLVLIKVSDTGSGIPPEKIHLIFDPFYTSKGVGGGTGLGLSVSLGIVQKHGGTIEVESDPGKGTVFTVNLPPNQYNEVETAESDDEDMISQPKQRQ